MANDWRKIIKDDIKAQRRENPLPWWYGWLYAEEVAGLLVILGFGIFAACLIFGGSR